MVKPLHTLLVRLKELEVKIGEEDGKRHVDFHVRKAITAQDTLAKPRRDISRRIAAIAYLEGTHLLPMHCLVPLENETFHRSSSLPFSPSQRSGLKVPGSGNSSALS